MELYLCQNKTCRVKLFHSNAGPKGESIVSCPGCYQRSVVKEVIVEDENPSHP